MSVAALPKIDSAERDPDKAVLEKVWYEETVPPIFRSQSNSRMSPSLKHSELADKHYDYVVIGAGIGGLYSAHLLANQLKSGSILVIDGRKAFDGLSCISGGEISVGLGTGNEWGRAGVGEETWNEFLRHTLLSTQKILNLADGFENATGCPVRTATGLITAITDEEMEHHACKEAAAIIGLVDHDLKYRPGPSNGIASVASLKDQFGHFVESPINEIMGGQRYRRGLLMPGEGAVNPAMLGVMMRHLAKGELDQNGELSERNGNVVVNFAEFLSVENICPRDGVISCHSKDENKKIVLKGERIIMAGISPKIVAGIDLEGADRRLQTNAYRTVIAVTKPLNGKLPNHFNAAVHDTTFHYNYVWADPETSRLMWGTGDFSMYPTMTKKEMLAFVRDQMAQTMKHVPEIEYVWPGDIPYTRDGLPGIYQKGKVAGWVAPGANGLAASVALSTIVCKASLGDEHAMQLAQNLMKRQTGFDPSKQAEHTPDYMKSAPFKVQDGWAQQDL